MSPQNRQISRQTLNVMAKSLARLHHHSSSRTPTTQSFILHPQPVFSVIAGPACDATNAASEITFVLRDGQVERLFHYQSLPL